MAGLCTARQNIWLAAGVSSARNLVVDQDYVYWTDASATVSRVSIAGGAVQPIWQGQAQPWGLAIDDTYVYWSNQLGGAIWRGAKDGSGSPQSLATATQPRDIALHLDNLYWIDQSADVSVVPKTGGAGSVAATPKNGNSSGTNVVLFETPEGPFVRNYGGSSWFFYSVLGGWSGGTSIGIGGSNAGHAEDGVNLYFNKTGCTIAAMNGTTGQEAGCFKGTNDIYSNIKPLAANACGIFYSKPDLFIGRIGVAYGIPVLDAEVDRAQIAGDFLYFHSIPDNSIGRLRLP